MKRSYLPPIQNISILNEDSHIEVFDHSVKASGYCNACTNRNIVKVFEITLRSLSFRLCNSCKDKLLEKLK